MLPLRDENPVLRRSIVNPAIIIANFLVFLAWEPGSIPGSHVSDVVQERFFFCHAFIPYELLHRTNLVHAGKAAGPFAVKVVSQLNLASACPNKSWLASVFVAMFLHGGWLHILGNMLFLWVFGNNVEDKLGRVRYLVFYLAAGVVATLAQTAVSHAGQSAIIPNLGASGAIAGVLGAYALMFPRRRVLTLVLFFVITAVYLPAFLVLGLWFVLQLFSGVGGLSNHVNSGGGVAFFAHIGGFSFGAVMALLFFPKERFGAVPPPRRPDRLGRRGLFRRRRRPDDPYG
jgi:membrane associated rhomboid family serine protease